MNIKMRAIAVASLASAAVLAAAPSAAVTIVLDANGFAVFSATHATPTTTFNDEFDFASGTGGIAGAAMEVSVQTANYLNLTTLTLNGSSTPFTQTAFGTGYLYTASITSPTLQPLNKLFVAGNVVGTGGSYSGNVSFTAGAVPETATWAMMLVGFGAVGSALRTSRRRSDAFA